MSKWQQFYATINTELYPTKVPTNNTTLKKIVPLCCFIIWKNRFASKRLESSELCLFVSLSLHGPKFILLVWRTMCDITPSSSSSLLSSKDKTHFSKLETCDSNYPQYSEFTDNDSLNRNRWPTNLEVHNIFFFQYSILGSSIVLYFLYFFRKGINLINTING